MTAATTTRPSGVGSSGPGEIEIRQRSQGISPKNAVNV
jgi:hypothetical protein